MSSQGRNPYSVIEASLWASVILWCSYPAQPSPQPPLKSHGVGGWEDLDTCKRAFIVPIFTSLNKMPEVSLLTLPLLHVLGLNWLIMLDASFKWWLWCNWSEMIYPRMVMCCHLTSRLWYSFYESQHWWWSWLNAFPKRWYLMKYQPDPIPHSFSPW